MQLGVAVTLTVTVVLAATGYWATYLTNLRLARRKDHLDRVNRQLSELYGPLYAHAEALDRAWQKFTAHYGVVWASPAPVEGASATTIFHGTVWASQTPATEEQAAVWRLWMTTVFMPLNRRMAETVVSHADLLRENTLPECLKDLYAHVACYEPILARWQEDGFSSLRTEDHISIAGDFPRQALDTYARNSYETLKLEQARLIAQLQHPRRQQTPAQQFRSWQVPPDPSSSGLQNHGQ